MNVYKNTDIASEFNVSNPTVSNWIQGALERKNNLIITKIREKYRVVINEHNKSELLRLAEAGFNHKNKIQKSNVKVSEELFKILSTTQLIELFNELKTNHQIPLKFTYLNGGAQIWDEYVKDGLKKGTYLTTSITDTLLQQSYDFLINKIGKDKKVNIVDLGSGNVHPTKNFISQINQTKLLNKYISIDISKELSKIAKKNLNEWFPEISVEMFNVDFEKDDLSEILFKVKSENVINLIFFIGGTYGNLEDREKFLKIIRGSLDGDDIVFITDKIDNIQGRSELGYLDGLIPSLIWIPQLLGFETQNCEIVKRYDSVLDSRAIFMKLDKDYDVQFDFGGSVKNLQFNKGDEIRLLKHHMTTQEEIIREAVKANLELTHFSTIQSRKQMICIFDVKKQF